MVNLRALTTFSLQSIHRPYILLKLIFLQRMFIRFSPPGAQGLRQQGGLDRLSRPLGWSSTERYKISDLMSMVP